MEALNLYAHAQNVINLGLHFLFLRTTCFLFILSKGANRLTSYSNINIYKTKN